MKKTIKEVVIYELEPQDIDILKNCLNYCLHRAMEHGKFNAGAQNEIQRLRRELGIIGKK